ncbi:MAG: hypothetical protein VKJ24_20235 [Synechococcales bacterium]|nr:hypothetical protein [Synechococcales bacterium]
MMLSTSSENATSPTLKTSTLGSYSYALVWRQKKLVVRRAPFRNAAIVVSAETDMVWLVERVRRSPVKLVLVDVRLGVEALKFWAEVTRRAGKTMYVNVKPGKEYDFRTAAQSYTVLGRAMRFLLIAIVAIVAQVYQWLHPLEYSDYQFYVNAQGKVLVGSGLCQAIQSHGLREQLWQWINQLRGRVSLSTAYLMRHEEICIPTELPFF